MCHFDWSEERAEWRNLVVFLFIHVTRQGIFASREAAKIAKKKTYIDEQDKQDLESLSYPVYRCRNKSTFIA